MERLWSPWRMPYLTRGEPTEGCVFCQKLSDDGTNDKENLVVYRGTWAAILMNLYPYNNGHLMVIPYEHVPTTESLSSEALMEIMQLVNMSMAILRRVVKPHGFNIGINIGKSAGAGIHEHVHVHVVPRWEGDTNFLQVCAHTRVIPEMLSDTYEKLIVALKEHLAENKKAYEERETGH